MKTRPNYAAGALSSVWLLIVGVPIYVMVSWSLQTRDSFLDRGPLAIPGSITLGNVAEVLDSGFMRYLLNTVVVTAASVALTLVVAIPAAYAPLANTLSYYQGLTCPPDVKKPRCTQVYTGTPSPAVLP